MHGESNMSHWSNQFLKENIFFVTPDVSRAIYFDHLLINYHIICSYFDPIIPVLRKQGNKIFCLQEQEETYVPVDNTGRLLENPLVVSYIKRNSKQSPAIFYFKPSLKIDLLLKRFGFQKIGNESSMNEKFENKIHLFGILQKYFQDNTIASEVGILGNLDFGNLHQIYRLPFVVQFGHGWAGKTTYIISDENKFRHLQKKFPSTKVKVAKHIKGFTVLNNCCIFHSSVLVSPPAMQISNIAQLSSHEGQTCGRQWPVAFIDDNQSCLIEDLSKKIGWIMHKDGYRGFYGVDFLIEAKTGEVYISEVNARLTASSSFYTRLEMGYQSIPFTVYHMAAFLGLPIEIQPATFNTVWGSQLILRTPSLVQNFDNFSFATFQLRNNIFHKVNEIYKPEELNNSEFIYIKNQSNEKHIRAELARIETKEPVLQETDKLFDWIKMIIS